MDKPDVDSIEGIPPAIAIEQKNHVRTTRSTVGTLTEINDYLKLLFARLATAYDPHTGETIQPDSPESAAAWAMEHLAGQARVHHLSHPRPARHQDRRNSFPSSTTKATSASSTTDKSSAPTNRPGPRVSRSRSANPSSRTASP